MNTHSSWLEKRQSGVLMHVSSLPGEYGIGNIGEASKDFIDSIYQCGFAYWQVCPVGPTGYGDSPYQSFSSYAGNPYFIDLGELIKSDLLKEEELAILKTLPTNQVDYGALYKHFWKVLDIASLRYRKNPLNISDFITIDEFKSSNQHWLEPYCWFMALKDFHSGAPWTDWDKSLRSYDPNRMKELPEHVYQGKLKHEFYQYIFAAQWQRLQLHARKRDVSIIGDLPIYVAMDSADTWAAPEQFLIDNNSQPLAVAGVPPDYFSDDGQLWGNPLYDWEYQKADGFSWWMQRLGHSFQMFDVLRLDHFRGFENYWSIPADAETARHGEWLKGPSTEFIDAVNREFPQSRIIAEDLGYIDRDVFNLRSYANYPGMKILQFAYDHDDNNVNLPHFYNMDAVAYTGTHDNDTCKSWLEGLSGATRQKVFEYLGITEKPSAWHGILAVFASVANLVIAPLQDLLNLDDSSRLNKPGTTTGNWRWRVTRSQLEQFELKESKRLNALHCLYDRVGENKQRDFSEAPENNIATIAEEARA